MLTSQEGREKLSHRKKTLGLDGSRAFLKYRTGIEEYSYQVIKHLREEVPDDILVRLYVRKKIAFEGGKVSWKLPDIDFTLPSNWQVKGLWAPRFWTQIRLSLEMLFYPVDTLFIPAHTVPALHPRSTVVVVHGLEYEVSPESYSLWERFYMRASIRFSVWAAKKVIAVSENTKKDLQALYKVSPSKIQVVYEGFIPQSYMNVSKKNNILFIGRLEERKNVIRIIEAFEQLQDQVSGRYTLQLAGKPGFGYEKIKTTLESSLWKKNIEELGYITEKQKNTLLQEAKAFVFPSLYEGFGLPVLEAQAAGTPVITSNTSSLPEVAGEAAYFVNPQSSEELAEQLKKLLFLPYVQYQELVEKGYKNLERFSWQKCAKELVGAAF